MAMLVTLVVAGNAGAASGTATTAGQTRTIDGTNTYRSTDQLIQYTPANGTTTGTNQYGYEAAVVNSTITQIGNGIGNMTIPTNGYVLSGHGTARTWLATYATIGATITLGSGGDGNGTELLPDVGIRTLRQFTIVNTNGKKLLKFPGVTPNIGAGPLEINATRPSSTSTDWVGRQTVYLSDGTKKVLPSTGAQFYYAGDGHNHWHIKDFDAYELYNKNGTKLKEGEKHGYCFEDNTSYRGWPGSSAHPASPANPVYNPDNVCGVGQPSTTSIKHGLSVGWGDTYPASLPDQAINITSIPDGTYVVKVTADWQNFWKETNENNNSASAQIKITGNTVTLISATDGL